MQYAVNWYAGPIPLTDVAILLSRALRVVGVAYDLLELLPTRPPMVMLVGMALVAVTALIALSWFFYSANANAPTGELAHKARPMSHRRSVGRRYF